jgi:hypothetical protein
MKLPSLPQFAGRALVRKPFNQPKENEESMNAKNLNTLLKSVRHSRLAAWLALAMLGLSYSSRATVLSGNVNTPQSVADQVTLNSVTNTAPITTTFGSNPAITINGTNLFGADVLSNNNQPMKFTAGSTVVQTNGTVGLTNGFRHLIFDSSAYLLNSGTVSVGKWFALGTGSTFVQNGGTVTFLTSGDGGADVAGREQIGGNLPGTATLILSNGTFNASNMLVGNDYGVNGDALNRRGVVVQEAGSTVTVNDAVGRAGGILGDVFIVSITNSTAGESSYTLKGGSLSVPNGNTRIYQWGELGGYGTVTTTSSRTLNMSGQVVANGYGVDRTLDLSQYGTVTNSTENGTERTGAGWYAQNKGKLTLPSIGLGAVTTNVNWGESSGDTTPDLVNSVRLSNFAVTGAGSLSISLLATDRGDIAAGPGFVNPIGIWDFSSTAAFSSTDLAFRYDDALAATLGVAESNLKLFHYVTGIGWTNVTTSINTTDNLIFAAGVTSFSQFAVAENLVPEPSAILLFVLGGLVLHRWPRRRG